MIEINIKRLETREDFEFLTKGDKVLVEWSDEWLSHNANAQKVMLYSIYENKSSDKEIICQLKGNHYFNYERYLNGNSVAVDVYKIV